MEEKLLRNQIKLALYFEMPLWNLQPPQLEKKKIQQTGPIF